MRGSRSCRSRLPARRRDVWPSPRKRLSFSASSSATRWSAACEDRRTRRAFGCVLRRRLPIVQPARGARRTCRADGGSHARRLCLRHSRHRDGTCLDDRSRVLKTLMRLSSSAHFQAARENWRPSKPAVALRRGREPSASLARRAVTGFLPCPLLARLCRLGRRSKAAAIRGIPVVMPTSSRRRPLTHSCLRSTTDMLGL